MADEEYVQLSSWEELITFIERAHEGIFKDDPAPPPPEFKPKPRRKKAPPQSEGLF